MLLLLILSATISCNNNSKEYELLLLKQYEELRSNQLMDFEIYFVRSQELVRTELEDEFEKMIALKSEMYKLDTVYSGLTNRNDKKNFIEKHRNKIKKIKSDVQFTDFKFLSKVNDSIFDAVVKQDFTRAYRDIMKNYWYEYHSIPYCGYTVYDSIRISEEKSNGVFINKSKNLSY